MKTEERWLLVELNPFEKLYRESIACEWIPYEGNLTDLKKRLLKEKRAKLMDYINCAPNEKNKKKRIKMAVPYTDVEFWSTGGFCGIII